MLLSSNYQNQSTTLIACCFVVVSKSNAQIRKGKRSKVIFTVLSIINYICWRCRLGSVYSWEQKKRKSFLYLWMLKSPLIRSFSQKLHDRRQSWFGFGLDCFVCWCGSLLACQFMLCCKLKERKKGAGRFGYWSETTWSRIYILYIFLFWYSICIWVYRVVYKGLVGFG